jgi:hypothetical protein
MSEIDWGHIPQPQAANVMRERQQEVAVKGAYLTKDYYGEPADDYERAAKGWLQEHNGTEGPAVMQSLGQLLRSIHDQSLTTKTPSPTEPTDAMIDAAELKMPQLSRLQIRFLYETMVAARQP